MDALPLRQFVEVIEGEGFHLPEGDGPQVEHVATHSARIRSGAAFFALAGSRVDGHDFVPAAAENGAIVAVVARERLDDRILACGIPVMAVDDPLRSLQRLAAWWRRSLSTRFIALVGSIGKTITKDCLVDLLSSREPVYGTPGSYNSQLGVPLAVLECPQEATTAVIELAVSDPGEMAHLARIVQPDHVILTNVGTRWRYRFTGREQQVEELLSVAGGLPDDGWVLLGQDDQDLRAAAKRFTNHVAVQGAPDGDVALPQYVRRSVNGPEPSVVEVSFPDGSSATVSLRTPSEEILADVELAASAAWLLGVDSTAVARTLQEYTPPATRMEIWRSPTGVTLIRDVATPDPIAVSSAVRTAKRLANARGRTIVVLNQVSQHWDPDAATDLAHALVTEQADEVFGISSSAPEAVAAVIDKLHGSLPARLFGSTDELRTHLIEHLRPSDVCLVQSAPDALIDELSSSLAEVMAPTRLYFDLSALKENVTTFRRLAGPGVRIMAVVKALAYGTDAVAASLGLQDSGVDALGVSSADEGVELRGTGTNLPILVMLGTGGEVGKMVRYRLTPCLYSLPVAEAVIRAAEDAAQPIGVHIEVDTGMHRTGLSPDEAVDLLRQLAELDSVRVEGIMTHFASADDPSEDDFSRSQLERLELVLDEVRALGLDPIVHAAATAAAIRFPAARYDMIRFGLGLFGLHPSPATAREATLTPVVSLVSRIVQVVDVPPGERVGYGGEYTAPPEGGRVGVVPAGYHDCVPRAFSNHGYVIVGGVRCRIVGRVSMDSMSVDLSGCPEATVGSDVLIYGRLGDWEVPLEEVSEAIGTIPYEVMARVGPRVQRIFTRH